MCHSMRICNKDSEDYESSCSLFVCYIYITKDIYVCTSKGVNVTGEHVCLGAKYAV